MTRKKIVQIDSVHQCNCSLGSKTMHPLVSVIDLAEASLTDYSIKFNFYTVILIENECNEFIHGRKHYDYSNATMIFLTPGQSLQMDKKKPLPQKGWLLAFHPLLINDTTLEMNISNYHFLGYHTDESLHLSQREKKKAVECLSYIKEELQHAIDRHSQTIISRYIELLFDFCSRFYERQFITRNETNKEIIYKMDLIWEEYIQSGKMKHEGMPSAEYCSSFLNLSSHYLTDLVFFETGKTINEYLQTKRVEKAKTMLLEKSYSIAQTAEWLGFPNEHYFSKLFRNITGVTPEEYQLPLN